MWRGPWYVPELRVLNFRNNSLTGIIPPSIGNATKMMLFSLSGNRISGNIPKEVGNLSQLAFFSLFDNQLTGSIPATLFNISSLLAVSLSLNSLSGPLLLDEGNIVSNLYFLSISHNQISGCIPSNICQLTELQVFSLSFNNIIGDIPRNISCLSKLEKFYIVNNLIKGTIPTSLGNISTLHTLNCRNNWILSNLRKLSFDNNSNLIGQIPEAIFNISSLEVIGFSFNNLSPTLKDFTWEMLKYLQVGNNPLNGVLPNSIGNLSSTIENFHIEDAHINGLIPKSIGNMIGLTSPSLDDNNLTGSIPSEIGKLKQLQGLYLYNNKLQGHIPEAVCHLSNLDILALEGNELSGLIPECFGNLSMLQHLYLDSNKFSSKFPLSLWKMNGLLYLDVSQNSIEGEGPQDIGGLKAIVELHLSSNHFSGMISTRFGELQNLQYLDLSNNSFFGQIPLSFANLINLEFLNLSLNALSGEIPSGGVFANSTLQSFLGNRAVTSSFLMFLLVSIWIMKRQKKGKSKDVEKVLEIGTHQLVSYHEIQRATNNFDESNLIGEGSSSSGSVYKGTLFGGTAVAIKVLDLENVQVCKRFNTECEMMRNVRHKNLVPVITTCSSDYIRAFVLRYMPNGSLENWLYKEDRHLNLHQRVTVMLDAAMAVEYLHHGHVTPIVHCDLKPANVLLDEDMVAYVGDFGISKILSISKSMAYTSTLGTLRYIAPEYGSEGIVSASGDVYSYGIMLMEVLTKRRPTDEEICNENLDLRKWITQSFSWSMMDVVDANLFSAEEQITSKSEMIIASMIELALDCTKEMPESRKTMKDVVKRLNKIKNAFLEIRPTDEEICNENIDLRKWITQSFSGTMMELVDANLFSEEEQITSKSEMCIASMIELALDCTKETPESRITMKDVVKRLNKIKN
ncbi:hypothetical protein H5410_020511, partial [Solanum commersonii]